MPRGDKSSYTNKQKRQAEHIEEGYEKRGVSEREAERRAWATVNKETGGGKKSGSGRGKKTNRSFIPAWWKEGRQGVRFPVQVFAIGGGTEGCCDPASEILEWQPEELGRESQPEEHRTKSASRSRKSTVARGQRSRERKPSRKSTGRKSTATSRRKSTRSRRTKSSRR